MEVTKPINFQNVEALSRVLKGRKIIKNRFSLDIPVRDCANAIYSAFSNEVEARGMTFNFDDDTKEHILAAAKWMSDSEGTPGLLMFGLYGNGKTTLAKAMMNLITWISERELGYSKRKKVRFMKAKAICRMIRVDPQSYEELFREEMLIIDELGEEPAEIVSYGNVYNPMIDLLSERYDQRLFTIITTNLNADEIRSKYGARIFDRFKEMFTPIFFKNVSYRSPADKATARS